MLKKLFVYVTIFLLVVRTFGPSLVFAQVDPSPTDTPAPTQSVDATQVNNTATDTNTTGSSANTGNNTTTTDPSVTPTTDPNATPTDTPTPTIDPNATPTVDPNATPTDTPTPTTDPSLSVDPNATTSSDISATNSADVANNVASTGNTGGNDTTSGSSAAAPESTPTPTPTPQVTVQTGDAVSVVAGSNTINTTSINSNVTDQTINVYGDETGDIDLSTLFQLVSNIVTNDNNSSPVINVQVTGVNNYAYLDNNITSSANTGGNSTTTPGGSASVTTGNADSVVSLINKVNLTVVNSSLHLVTINIFGHLTGNIILPNIAPLQSTTCATCGVSFNVNNQATVNNNVASTANTGTNTTTASEDATVTTGNAQSDVNVVNVVNQNVLGMIFENLFINEFGYWNGNFLGWDAFAPTAGGTLALSSGTPEGTGTTPNGSVNSTTINNTAVVTNHIASTANTGGNSTSGQQVGVTTGDAYSAVSLINFINSNFFNTLGFFGFINIFGQWDGNIGGADKFVTPTPTPEADGPVAQTQSTQESGGQLSQTNSNNVGTFVFPGDTVTFFMTTKNIGTGKVYGATLNLSLFKGGQNVGGTSFNLGDIPVSRGVRISTGLVLSKNALPGEYVAKAIVTGTTGPDNTSVSAEADSTFTIFGNTVASNTQTPNIQGPLHHAVLGTRTNKPTPESDAVLLLLLGLTLGSYLTIKGIRNRQSLRDIWENSSSFKQKLLTIRILLL